MVHIIAGDFRQFKFLLFSLNFELASLIRNKKLPDVFDYLPSLSILLPLVTFQPIEFPLSKPRSKAG